MPSAHDVSQIHIKVNQDATQAVMIIGPDMPTEMLAVDLCLHMICEAGVEVTDLTRQAVIRLIASAGSLSSDAPESIPAPGIAPRIALGSTPGGTSAGLRQVVIARATLPRHGEDGSVRWFVDRPHDEDTSHYDRSAFAMVECGQVLGEVIEPSPGQDGRDVRSRTIPARPARPTGSDIPIFSLNWPA